MNKNKQYQFKALENLVLNTPLLEITLSYKGNIRKVYTKLEYYSLTGSIKDRIAYYILKKSYENNLIKESDTIIEATSGNTGIAFSGIGRFLGHKVIIVMPEWMSEERKKLIKSFGADLRLVTKEEGGFKGSVRITQELAKTCESFLPCQFANKYNVETHYNTTAKEIEKQMKIFGFDNIDGFIAGVGTGGTLMGVSKYFKEQNPNFKSFPLEPSNSKAMTGGFIADEHQIQGIGDGFIPEIIKLNEVDNIINVDDNDSIIMAQKIAKKFGIGVGVSSGANLLGVLKAQDIIGEDKKIVTVFSDDNKKYLTTNYADNIEVEDSFISKNFMSKHIELISINAVR